MILIKKLTQINNYSFCVLWSDDKVSTLELALLQKNCPCARCTKSENKDNLNVRALKISSVGNYALRIDFASGCSRGIFTFNFLRTLNLEES